MRSNTTPLRVFRLASPPPNAQSGMLASSNVCLNVLMIARQPTSTMIASQVLLRCVPQLHTDSP